MIPTSSACIHIYTNVYIERESFSSADVHTHIPICIHMFILLLSNAFTILKMILQL